MVDDGFGSGGTVQGGGGTLSVSRQTSGRISKPTGDGGWNSQQYIPDANGLDAGAERQLHWDYNVDVNALVNIELECQHDGSGTWKAVEGAQKEQTDVSIVRENDDSGMITARKLRLKVTKVTTAPDMLATLTQESFA